MPCDITTSDEVVAVTCECPVSYHNVIMPDGAIVQRWDEHTELPDIMQMCFGRCARCGLPFHTGFTTED